MVLVKLCFTNTIKKRAFLLDVWDDIGTYLQEFTELFLVVQLART